MLRKVSYVLLLVALILALAACATRTVRLTPSAIVPAADATAKVGTDDNGNTSVELKVEHLAKPENLTPPATAYVVWFEPSGQAAQNQGVLRVDQDLKAEFRGITPYRTFSVLITAEGDPRAMSPSGAVIVRQEISR